MAYFHYKLQNDNTPVYAIHRKSTGPAIAIFFQFFRRTKQRTGTADKVIQI
jgi:hypothetical protein